MMDQMNKAIEKYERVERQSLCSLSQSLELRNNIFKKEDPISIDDSEESMREFYSRQLVKKNK